jgi:hypothetical protein
MRLSRIRLPPRVCDGKAIARPGFWEPNLHQLRHPRPRDPIPLATTPQRAPPEVGDLVQETNTTASVSIRQRSRQIPISPACPRGVTYPTARRPLNKPGRCLVPNISPGRTATVDLQYPLAPPRLSYPGATSAATLSDLNGHTGVQQHTLLTPMAMACFRETRRFFVPDGLLLEPTRDHRSPAQLTSTMPDRGTS